MPKKGVYPLCLLPAALCSIAGVFMIPWMLRNFAGGNAVMTALSVMVCLLLLGTALFLSVGCVKRTFCPSVNLLTVWHDTVRLMPVLLIGSCASVGVSVLCGLLSMAAWACFGVLPVSTLRLLVDGVAIFIWVLLAPLLFHSLLVRMQRPQRPLRQCLCDLPSKKLYAPVLLSLAVAAVLQTAVAALCAVLSLSPFFAQSVRFVTATALGAAVFGTLLFVYKGKSEPLPEKSSGTCLHLGV